MESCLWAPWRMEFIKNYSANNGCVFCRIARESPEKDAENLVVRRGTDAIVVMNRFPYNSGHLMIMPNDHIGEFSGISSKVTAEMDRLIREAIATIEATMHPQGFNLGMNLGAVAGAGIKDHLHWHVVPRWQGDTNFMPVVGEAKVISEHIQETRACLLANWRKL